MTFFQPMHKYHLVLTKQELQLLTQALAELKQNSQMFGIDLTNDEDYKSVAYKILNLINN